jgi:excisionase family DNA binding protein
MNNYVTRAELAERLRASIRTIARWEREGIIPAPIQLGRKYLYDTRDIETHIAKARVMK